jgi:hypothetical protein
MLASFIRLVRLPIDDYLAALERFAVRWTWARLIVVLVSLVVGWWVYVPLHELAHELGNVLGGGAVSPLDIDPIYGAALLRRIFPFINVGSDYAGQLRDFDRSSDLRYLLTDFLPFVATIVIGVPMLRAAARPQGNALWQAALFGASIPVAFAPFISLTGDYYEMGSILISRLAATVDPGFDVARWRSDDLFKLAGALFGADGTGMASDAVGLGASFAVGAVLAFLTYAAGVACARILLGRTPEHAGGTF